MAMSLFSYILLVGAIGIFVGILLCLGILSATGHLHIGDLFHKPRAGLKGGEILWDIDYRRLRDIYILISKLTATLKSQRVLEIALDLGSRVLATPNIPAEKLVRGVVLFSVSEYKKNTLLAVLAEQV